MKGELVAVGLSEAQKSIFVWVEMRKLGREGLACLIGANGLSLAYGPIEAVLSSRQRGPPVI